MLKEMNEVDYRRWRFGIVTAMHGLPGPAADALWERVITLAVGAELPGRRWSTRDTRYFPDSYYGEGDALWDYFYWTDPVE